MAGANQNKGYSEWVRESKANCKIAKTGAYR